MTRAIDIGAERMREFRRRRLRDFGIVDADDRQARRGVLIRLIAMLCAAVVVAGLAMMRGMAVSTAGGVHG